MAILTSCCCCRSLRTGSFACGIYTLVFYTLVTTACAVHISSVLDAPDILSFSVVLLALSGLCVISSILLFAGLCVDNKHLLLPWMSAISMSTLLDLILSFYLIGDAASIAWKNAILCFKIFMAEDPFLGVFLVVDYLICGLNVYCLLCVASQYQEYLSNRGGRGQRPPGRASAEVPVLNVVTPSMDECRKTSFISTDEPRTLLSTRPSSSTVCTGINDTDASLFDDVISTNIQYGEKEQPALPILSVASNVSRPGDMAQCQQIVVANKTRRGHLALCQSTSLIPDNLAEYQIAENLATCQIAENLATCQIAENLATCQIAENLASRQIAENLALCQLDNLETTQIAYNFHNEDLCQMTDNILYNKELNSDRKPIPYNKSAGRLSSISSTVQLLQSGPDIF